MPHSRWSTGARACVSLLMSVSVSMSATANDTGTCTGPDEIPSHVDNQIAAI